MVKRYFDSSKANKGEYPVYACKGKCLYADNFIDSLKMRIEEE